MSMMSIGEAAEASGVSTKMIRHYEAIGLIEDIPRSESGYRLYGEREVRTLQFVRRARDLGFSIEQMRELLTLWRERNRASSDVKRLALEHVATLERKAMSLQAMIETLRHLADHCAGDERPDCPIIEGLATSGTPTAPGPEREPFGTIGIDPVQRRPGRRDGRSTTRSPLDLPLVAVSIVAGSIDREGAWKMMHHYEVPTMSCGHCAGTIRTAVRDVDAAAEVTVDVAARKVCVRSEHEPAEIGAAIRSAGYENTPIES